MLWLAIASRWIHVGTAVVLVGGLVFMRFVLGPAAAQLPDDAHAKLKELVMGTWKKFVHAGILLFIASGFFNYYVAIESGIHKGEKLYHPLIGTKILLAVGIFFLASVLVGRSKSFEGMRANAKFWQGVMIAMAVVVIAISGYAKVALKGDKAAPTAAVSQMN